MNLQLHRPSQLKPCALGCVPPRLDAAAMLLTTVNAKHVAGRDTQRRGLVITVLGVVNVVVLLLLLWGAGSPSARRHSGGCQACMRTLGAAHPMMTPSFKAACAETHLAGMHPIWYCSTT